MMRIIKKIIRIIVPFRTRVKIFWKYESLQAILRSIYIPRATDDFNMAQKNYNYINQLDAQTKTDIINNLTKNLNEDSKIEVNNFIKRNKLIVENNFIDTTNQFNKKEIAEQFECSRDRKITKKKFSKYKMANYSPESLYGLNGLKWIPGEIKEKLSNGIFLDIGAYDGDSSIAFLENFHPQKIFAFEPEENNFLKLKINSQITKNNIIIPIKSGISNYIGQARISNQRNGSKIIYDNQGEKIDITTIDKFCKNNNIEKVDLIKMDIEGEETKALQGAKETILKNSPVLAISIYHNPDDFFFIKPWLENLNPAYKFFIKKAHPFALVNETMLIAYIDDTK